MARKTVDRIRLVEARLERDEIDAEGAEGADAGADAGVWKVRGAWGSAGIDGCYEEDAGADLVETAERLLSLYLVESNARAVKGTVDGAAKDARGEHYAQAILVMPDGSRWFVRAVRVQYLEMPGWWS